MSKHNKKQPSKPSTERKGQAPANSSSRTKSLLSSLGFILLVVAIVGATKIISNSRSAKTSDPAASNIGQGTPTAAQISNSPAPPNTNQASLQPARDLSTMEVNQAVMVTVELDFGTNMPTIGEALRYIARRSKPADGQGRTFAILDAYGEPTPDKKKLHISMHVSTEKPGEAELAFTKTGEILWRTRIVPGTNTKTFTGKDLTIYLDSGTGEGKAWILDGSGGPPSVLEAKVRDLGLPVREVWPDGAEREMTFIYSACGCPVKVMVRRTGERTARTKELPVMFPDDPAVVTVINRLMGW